MKRKNVKYEVTQNTAGLISIAYTYLGKKNVGRNINDVLKEILEDYIEMKDNEGNR